MRRPIAEPLRSWPNGTGSSLNRGESDPGLGIDFAEYAFEGSLPRLNLISDHFELIVTPPEMSKSRHGNASNLPNQVGPYALTNYLSDGFRSSADFSSLSQGGM
jgi:hypothetical protein